MKKEIRSSKWTFLIYQENVPANYLDILNTFHVPYVISPWHNKDIDFSTRKPKKPHKHAVLCFDSLKSRSQVVDLVSRLHGPSHIEVVHSPKGMFDYFTHADNPDKSPYSIEDIESGCGFNLAKFLQEQNLAGSISKVIDVINEQEVTEFRLLVNYAKENNPSMLEIIVNKTYFFSKYIDSVRYSNEQRRK